VLELPDKRRTTVEIIETPSAFIITMHLPKPGRNRRESRLIRRWLHRAIEHTRLDPRPDVFRLFADGQLVFCGVERLDSTLVLFGSNLEVNT
jgi:hypothetical protein